MNSSSSPSKREEKKKSIDVAKWFCARTQLHHVATISALGIGDGGSDFGPISNPYLHWNCCDGRFRRFRGFRRPVRPFHYETSFSDFRARWLGSDCASGAPGYSGYRSVHVIQRHRGEAHLRRTCGACGQRERREIT